MSDRPGTATDHAEPTPTDPALRWARGWAQETPILAALFEAPPGIAVDGEIREVRLRRSGGNGGDRNTYAVQVGYLPRQRGQC